MVLPWKCKSYLPTSRAILQTNCKKGSSDEELGALLELLDLPKSNCARPVLPGLLYLTSLEELLPEGFASYGQSELPPGWLFLTQCRGPSLHSHLGQLLGWWWWWWPSHILQPPSPASWPLPPASSPPLSWARAPWLGIGGELERGPPSILC